MKPNPLLLLLMMMMTVLYNGNKYLQTFEFPACDTWAIVPFKF